MVLSDRMMEMVPKQRTKLGCVDISFQPYEGTDKV